MALSEQESYQGFIDWLGTAWIGLPAADELLPLIRARYSPEDAALLTGMPFSPKSLEELAQLKGMDKDELGATLDILAGKGIVYSLDKAGSRFYSLNDSFFTFLRSSFWPGKTDEVSTTLAPLANQYYLHGYFDQYAHIHVRGLRALPIEETIHADGMHKVLPYEVVAKVLDGQDYFCVAVCPCRHRKNLDQAMPNCTYSTENCLHFGSLAHYMVSNGLGREISRKEAHTILRQAADEGLVHGVSNWVKGVDTICNCCKCCCMWFESFHVLKHTKSMDASNYLIQSSPETCRACGLCVKRCPMEALRLEDSVQATNKIGKASIPDTSLCIGCGVCVHKCPTNSLKLVHRGEVSDPPADPRDHVKRFFMDRQSG